MTKQATAGIDIEESAVRRVVGRDKET